MKFFSQNLVKEIRSKNEIIEFPLEEIEEIQSQAGIRFPKAYIEFLQLVGKDIYCLTGLDYLPHNFDQYRRGAESALYFSFAEHGLGF